MSLSIMGLLTVYSSQSAAHPHRHQRQVQRPWEHEGIHQHVVVPPRFVLVLPPQLLCLLVGSLPPRLKAPHITLTTTEELQLGRFSRHAFFWYYVLRACTTLSQHQDPV